MPIQLTPAGVRQILPNAPQGVVDAFVAKQAVLDKAGITHTRVRLSVAFSQVEHETAGFTIRDLTENINYSAAGAARVWPGRFKDADAVKAKYGTAPGWQLKLINDVYGNRMGNRPGTDDGSKFIGRGGPQITGRDGYREVGKRAALDLEAKPALACAFEYQPEILAAFWTWKNLSPVVDVGGLKAATKPWNGGYIGMADREAKMAGNNPVIARLANVDRIAPIAKDMPGEPPTKDPPKETVDAATKKERAARDSGIAGAGGGAAGEATKASTEVPYTPLLSPFVTYTLIGAGVAVIVIAALLIARKKAIIKSNWY